VEVVTSLSQGRTAAAQCGLFTHRSVPVIFEPPCSKRSDIDVKHIFSDDKILDIMLKHIVHRTAA